MDVRDFILRETGMLEDGKNRRRIKLKTGERGGKEKTSMTATDKLGAS